MHMIWFLIQLSVFLAITLSGWNFWGENPILIYQKIFKHYFYAGRALQGARDVTTKLYPPIISAPIDEKNRQIVTTL